MPQAEVTRHEGGRDAGRRLPDRFTLAGTELPAEYAAHTTGGSASAPDDTKQAGPAKDAKASAKKDQAPPPVKPKGPDDRLKPGQLDGLVLAYLQENAAGGPHGPTTVAKALKRSSGAVGNCLVRLADAKQVRQVSDKPRRYSLAA